MPSSIDGGRCSHVDVCYINTNDFKRRYKRGLVITINITYINVFVLSTNPIIDIIWFYK